MTASDDTQRDAGTAASTAPWAARPARMTNPEKRLPTVLIEPASNGNPPVPRARPRLVPREFSPLRTRYPDAGSAVSPGPMLSESDERRDCPKKFMHAWTFSIAGGVEIG